MCRIFFKCGLKCVKRKRERDQMKKDDCFNQFLLIFLYEIFITSLEPFNKNTKSERKSFEIFSKKIFIQMYRLHVLCIGIINFLKKI